MMSPETVAVRAPRASAALRYLDPESTMTLREGLAEYFRSMPDLLDVNALEGKAKELFDNHDTAHVVFGCDVSLRHEAMMDTWTVFGTDVGFFAYMRYLTTPEARRVVTDAGVLRSLWGALLAVPDAVRVIGRARRMKKKWPWRDHERYLDRPLVEIRRDLGLAILA